MAQLNASISQVTSTDNVVHKNLPIVLENTIRAGAAEVKIGSCDANLYPAIAIDTVNSAVQYWIYPLGDTTNRDLDLALF